MSAIFHLMWVLEKECTYTSQTVKSRWVNYSHTNWSAVNNLKDIKMHFCENTTGDQLYHELAHWQGRGVYFINLLKTVWKSAMQQMPFLCRRWTNCQWCCWASSSCRVLVSQFRSKLALGSFLVLLISNWDFLMHLSLYIHTQNSPMSNTSVPLPRMPSGCNPYLSEKEPGTLKASFTLNWIQGVGPCHL